MAGLSPVAAIERDRIVPVFNDDDLDVTLRVADILFANGFSILEFTNRSAAALSTFERVVPRLGENLPDMTVGAGSISGAEAARAYTDSGATFVVGPATSEAVATVCSDRGVPYMPGCGTLTEILRGHQMGSEIVKLFPASIVGGPQFLAAVRAPCPDIKVMPTGGIDPSPESLAEWFRAGAVGVGLGSTLVPSAMLAVRDWDAIAANVARVAENLRISRTEALEGS